MKIKLIVFGSLSTIYKQQFEHYVGLISKFAHFSIIEFKEKTFKNIEQEKQYHTNLVIENLPKQGRIIYLTFKGQHLTSEQFTNVFDSQLLTFIIGPSHGLIEEQLDQHKITKIAFSKLTFAHQLFRVMLSEQIYRALSIKNNTKYHK